MRKYEVYHYATADFRSFATIECNNIRVEGGSIIFYNYRPTEPMALFPSSQFYVTEVTDD